MSKKVRNPGKYLFILSNEEDYNKVISFSPIGYIDYLKNLFEFEEYIVVKLNILNSAEEFLFFSPFLEHQKWIAGRIGFPNMIHIYSYNSIEENTIHKKDEYKGILFHEITHIYYLSSSLPQNDFLNEGFAQYFSGQPIKKLSREISKERLIKLLFTSSKELNKTSNEILEDYYSFSQHLIKNLSENLGNKNLIDNLRKCKDNDKLLKFIEENFQYL